jgi:hypothetical protein
MSYKSFYLLGNDSNYFDACRQTAGASLKSIYACCKEKCGKSRVCTALCSQIYPGTIIEDCAFEQGCWDSGTFRTNCVQEKNEFIHDCCLKKCRTGQWSLNQSVASRLPIAHTLNCDDYCSESTVIVNRR